MKVVSPKQKQTSAKVQPFSVQTLLAGLLTLFPIVLYGLVWDRLAVNVPKWDDHALKAYLFYSEQETTFVGKIYQLFRQHNEHRIVLDRLITWLDFNLFGKLNYRHLMALGNLSLLGLLGIFGNILLKTAPLIKGKSQASSPLLFLPPLAFLLFNLSSWENAFWGMASLQNFSIVLWVIGAIYLLSYSGSLVGAIMLGQLATLTSGNGLLIWPIGALLLLLQRRYRPLGYWLGGAILTIGLYFFGYEKPEGNPPVRGSVLDLLKGFLAFNGAAGEVLPVGDAFTVCLWLGLLLTAGLGVVAMVSFAKLISPLPAGKSITPEAENQRGTARLAFLLTLSRSTPAPIHSFLLGSLAFLLGTASLVAWSRVGFGLEVLITSRYKIYSLTLLCVAYLFLVTQVQARWRPLVAGMGLLGSVMLAGLSYLTYADEVIWWRRWMLTNQFNWTYLTNKPVAGIDPTTARWVDNAPAYYDSCLKAIYTPDHTAAPIAIDTVYEANGQWVIRTTTTGLADLPKPSLRNPDSGVTLLLQSSQRTYLYGALPGPANNALTALRRGLYPSPELLTSLPANEPKAGTYQLAFLVNNGGTGSCVIHPTTRTLTIQPHENSELKKNW